MNIQMRDNDRNLRPFWKKIKAMYYIWKGHTVLQNIDISDANIHSKYPIESIDNVFLFRNRFYKNSVIGKEIIVCPRCGYDDDIEYVGEYGEGDNGDGGNRDFVCHRCNGS